MSLRLYSRTGNRRCSTLFPKFPLISFLSHVAMTRWLMSVAQFLQICTDLTYHLHRFSHRKWPHLCRFPTLGVSGSSKVIKHQPFEDDSAHGHWGSPVMKPPIWLHPVALLQKRRPSRNATDASVAPRVIKQGMLVTPTAGEFSWKILAKCHG